MTTPELRCLPILRELIGFDTTMWVVVAHKGKRSYRCHVRGREAHSSLAPTGVNAVEYAAALIAFLQQMARRQQHDGPFDEDYDIAHTTVHVGTVHGGTALNIVPAECQFDFEIRHLPQDDPEKMFVGKHAMAHDCPSLSWKAYRIKAEEFLVGTPF